jgi:hypothetical protein
MKKRTTIINLTILAIGLAIFLISVEQVAHRVDQQQKLERCLEEYGEGDLGMEMCYANQDNNQQ